VYTDSQKHVHGSVEFKYLLAPPLAWRFETAGWNWVKMAATMGRSCEGVLAWDEAVRWTLGDC
jgi:hypothetical protein